MLKIGYLPMVIQTHLSHANCVDPDQIPNFIASKLDLYLFSYVLRTGHKA